MSPLTEESVVVDLEVPHALRREYAFTPGQHLTLRTTIDGEDVRRSYSVCVPPSSRRLAVAVKRLDGGAFSTFVHGGLRPGAVVDVMTPAGRFGAHPDPARAPRSYGAIAAGSGITPVMSVLASLLETEPASTCTLLYGNQASRTVMFAEELADLKDTYGPRFSLTHVLSREHHDVDLLHGRLDSARLARLLDAVLPPCGVDEWFLCGPHEMVTGARALLLERGSRPVDVHTELFYVEGEAPRPTRRRRKEGAPGATVTVRLEGRTTTLAVEDGTTVLEALLAVRPEAPYACKGGVCGTCRARLVSGEVVMGRVYALEDDEVEAGFVLACQSVPVTDRCELDFDA